MTGRFAPGEPVPDDERRVYDVRDVIRGSTRPHRGSWLIWAVTAIVVYASQRADGASWSLIMAGAQAVLTAFVFLLCAAILAWDRAFEVPTLSRRTRLGWALATAPTSALISA